jgi:DNA-binding XRE family transcriptional regulator
MSPKGNPKHPAEKINRIKEVLADKGVTQAWLAEKMKHKSRNTMANICANYSQPSLKHLKEIAKHLDVDIRDLLYPTKV